jgi:hypothetical protein
LTDAHFYCKWHFARNIAFQDVHLEDSSLLQIVWDADLSFLLKLPIHKKKEPNLDIYFLGTSLHEFS